MGEITIKRFGEMDFYKGPGAVPGIKFHRAAHELGVTAWGMGVIEIEPNVSGYPEHDHTKDLQEEVYVVLRGSAKLKAGGTETTLEAGTLVRVGPSEKRHFTAGPQGLVLLAIGATPGKAYEPRR